MDPGRTTPVGVLGIALPSATFAVSVSDDGIVREWDAYKGTAERLLSLGDRRVVALALSPDARHVVCATHNEPFLHVYDEHTGNLQRTIGPTTASIRALAVTSRGGVVVAAFDDHVLRCYDLQTGALEHVLPTGPSQVHAVSVSEDGNYAVTVCADGALRRYDLGSGGLVAEIETGGSSHAVAVVLVGAVAMIGCDNGTISQWNLADTTAGESFAVGSAGVRALAATSGGELVLVLRGDGSIGLHQMRDGAVVADLTAQLGASPSAAPEAEQSALSPPPLTAPVLDEDVQFTVYRPARLPPDHWTSMLVFVHKSELVMDPASGVVDPVEEVEARARAHFRKVKTHASRVDAQAALIRGGQLRIVLELPGITCIPSAADVVWWEPIHEVRFQLYARSELLGSVVRGWVRIWCGPLILGELTIALPVEYETDQASTAAGLAAHHLTRYRKIFPSYSRRDSRMIEPFAIAANVIGDQYLQDVLALRSGEQWQDRLLEFIEGADVFQLFWSSNSMRSAHCRTEWEHALALNRPRFVCPLYWEEPFPEAPELGMPPKALRGLHFARIPAADLPAHVAPPTDQQVSHRPPDGPQVGSAVPAEAGTEQTARVGPETKKVHWLLVVSPGTLRGRRVSVSRDKLLVGRAATSDLVLEDPYVSRIHAALHRRGDELYVEDLGSAGGTTVNGIPVTEPRLLTPGDLVAFATVQLQYQEVGRRGTGFDISSQSAENISNVVGDQRIGGTPGKYEVGRQELDHVVSNVGRDQYNSHVQYLIQHRENLFREVAATKTRARTLAFLGFLLQVLGFAVYGAAISGFELIGLAAGLLGSVLLVAGIVLYAAAAAKRRRADRETPLPLPPPP